MENKWGNLTEEELELQNKANENSDGQSQDGGSSVDYEKQYKELQGEFDRRNEKSFKKDLKLAELDKKYILEVEDKKIQNKLVKELYWYDSLEELKLIQWDKFYEEHSEEDKELDRTTQLEQELKIIKHKLNKDKIEEALAAYTSKHPDVFKDMSAINKLKDELQYVSDNLDAKERVERAGKLAFGVYVDKTSEAYMALQERGTKAGSQKPAGEQAKENANIIEDIFNKRFGK